MSGPGGTGAPASTLSALLFALGDALDDEGRPLGERRASSAAKARVPMEVVACPYAGERLGRPMNASALERMTAHCKEVLREIAAFHHLLPAGPPGWDAMLLAVLDQLAGAAVYRLRQGPDARLPAARAAGYKLSAGYFAALHRLLEDRAHGVERPETAGAFLDFVQRERLLLGSSEVCAGPPQLLRKVTEVFLHGAPDEAAWAAPERLGVAAVLSSQIQLGLAWKLFDAAAEERLLLGPAGRSFAPRTRLLAQSLSERRRDIERTRPAPSWSAALQAVPAALPPRARAELLASIRACGEPSRGEHAWSPQLAVLATAPEGAFGHLEPARSALLVRQFCDWLEVHRQIFRIQWQLELELRRRLEIRLDAPLAMSPLMMPLPHALRWFEAALGHWLVCTPGPEPALELRSASRAVALDAGP